MDLSEWDPIYERIIADMGYSRYEDESAVRVLSAVTQASDLVDPDDIRHLFAGTVTVAGAAERLESDLVEHGVEGTLVAAGSATGRLLDAGHRPDVIVTDLDGDIDRQIEASSYGALTFIHAHGDNRELISAYAGLFKGPVVLTTQSRPTATVFDFGGFTDGDRSVCIAQSLGASKVRLIGFDFESPYGKGPEDYATKLKKLSWAKEIIASVRGTEIAKFRCASESFAFIIE